MPRREMTDQERRLAEETYAAIQQATNSTARSQQQAEFRLGVSNLGHCRQYARYMTLQTPFSDVRDKTAAFLGTVVGEAVEAALRARQPGWIFQPTLTFKIPSGGEIPGHADVIIPSSHANEEFPQGIVDIKTRAELETIRRNGANQQQRFQKTAYCSAAIDAGFLDPAYPIYITNMWIDRSGTEVMPYVLTEPYDPDVLLAIDSWIEDVKYAVIHGEDAPRDPSREFCWSYCEYATICRSGDTDVEGLITDPDTLAGVEAYLEATALEKEATLMKNRAKLALRGANGSTGTHTVRWIEVGATSFQVDREASTRLDVRPVRKVKS